MLGSPLASVSIPGAQGHCLRVVGEIMDLDQNGKAVCSSCNLLAFTNTSVEKVEEKKNKRKKIEYERDGTQPDDEMHAILGGPINEEE
ncbi:hypothetical protein FEM48_Zijuj02G0015000 [Ziziphus jujuba var. spinosa]|uniref:Uncharacterized protein n=1 Tax=Ziziphus jujuba var. spinosa TaxID=714518 RepID=A0A978VSU2_ZIZJJ|nr:hypothetical protein FEM48_Zijuj02G0015000 [Ziziphus jujuba var. spinosa]